MDISRGVNILWIVRPFGGAPGRGVSQVLRPHRVRRLALQGWKPEAAAGGSETMGNGPWK